MIRHTTIYEGGTGEIVEKKSRFIAHVSHVESIAEAQEFIEGKKKEFWDARHNCYAFSVGTGQPMTRCSDDGEPAGTAGKPILEVILGSGLLNVVIVVTRYFGGTLLGTGGLVRAYSRAARAGIEASLTVEKVPGKRYLIHTNYTDLGKLQYALASEGVITEDTDYSDKVDVTCLIAADDIDRVRKRLTEATSGRAVLEEREEVYFGQAGGRTLVFS